MTCHDGVRRVVGGRKVKGQRLVLDAASRASTASCGLSTSSSPYPTLLDSPSVSHRRGERFWPRRGGNGHALGLCTATRTRLTDVWTQSERNGGRHAEPPLAKSQHSACYLHFAANAVTDSNSRKPPRLSLAKPRAASTAVVHVMDRGGLVFESPHGLADICPRLQVGVTTLEALSMAHAPLPLAPRGFGETMRKDAWWLEPLVVFIGLSTFVVYSTWAAFQGNHYTFGPYLSPFYAELSAIAARAIRSNRWGRLSAVPPALLILRAPGVCRFTGYYRGAYYNAFLADLRVRGGEHANVSRENSLPLIMQERTPLLLYLASDHSVLGGMFVRMWFTTRQAMRRRHWFRDLFSP